MDILSVNEDDVRLLLTRHFFSKKTKSFRILTPEETHIVHNSAIHRSLDDVRESCNFLSVPQYRVEYDRFNEIAIWQLCEKKAIGHLEVAFPKCREILDKFHGRLIVAGGSIMKAIMSGMVASDSRHLLNHCDMDFFFIDSEVSDENIPDCVKIEKANKTLSEVVTTLIKSFFNEPANVRSKNRMNAYVTRSDHVTSVYLFDKGPWSYRKYQFIHRVYPNAESVLGGFDLGASMVGYDGQRIFGTELGLWSVFNKTNIVDIGCASTSFASRISKYQHYVRMLFPGLPPDVLDPRKDILPLEEFVKLFRVWCNENGLGFMFVNTLDDIARRRDILLVDSEILRKIKIFSSQHGRYFDRFPYLFTALGISHERAHPEKDAILKCPDFKIVKYFTYDRHRYNIKQCNKTKSDYERGSTSVTSDYEDGDRPPISVADANFSLISKSNFENVMAVLQLCHREFDGIGGENAEHLNANEAIRCRSRCLNQIRVMINGDAVKVSEIQNLVEMRCLFGGKVGDMEQISLISDKKVFDEEFVENWDAAIEYLKGGPKWILRNPGRQWTSAINPKVVDPRDWYGPKYQPFWIGYPEVETLLRLGRRDPGCLISKLPRDIFKYLLHIVMMTLAFD